VNAARTFTVDADAVAPRQWTVDLATPARALAIAAHPDDVEFGAGATLAKWCAAGCEILHVICTDGSRGSWDRDEDTSQLVLRRQDEQREASRALGGKSEVAFLGWPDGELESGLRQRWQVAYWIRRFRPDVVLGHDPWRRYRLHPDHRNAGFLATDGVVAARDPHFFPEQDVAHHRPSTLLLWEADTPDHLENTVDTHGVDHVDSKLAALLCHKSQFRSTMRIDDPDAGDEVTRFRDRVLQRVRDNAAPASRAGLTDVAAAEAFKAIHEV
jgi:LmbE family N-acetylglucosaminyl deacetylase